MCAQNHSFGLGPIQTCKSCHKVAVLHEKKHTDEGWNQYSLLILELSTMLCVLKTTDEVWDPYRHVSLVLKSLFASKKRKMRAGTHIDLSFWCKSRCFACTKRQVMSGNHRDLLFRSISRCFASKNHRWGLEPIELSYSGANHAVVHAQNEWSCLGPLETCYSGPEFAVFHAKITGGVLDPQALVILMLATLFCM